MSMTSAISSTKRKDANILAARERLNMYTRVMMTNIVGMDSTTASEVTTLGKTVQTLHDALHEKGRTGLSRLIKPTVRFQDIMTEIKALDEKLMTILRYSNGTPPAMMRVNDWARQMEANSPSKLNEIMTRIAQLLQALMENSTTTLGTNSRTRAIEYLEPQRNLPNIPQITRHGILDSRAARSHRAVVDQFRVKFERPE
ncbi:hypothetical protein BGX26_002293 [Mortierella sp. AD094]|nr:hypothetical protein BGX26_002293 [Mortierella sp. AD094]